MSSSNRSGEESAKAEQTAAPSSDPRPATAPSLSFKDWLERLAYPAVLLTLAALSSPISQATLAPVFGALPSAVNHQEAIIATSILAFTLRYFLRDQSTRYIAQSTAIWAFWVPVIQYYLFPLSRFLGPQTGPAVLGFLSCHTILIPTVYAAAEASEALNLSTRYGRWYGTVLPAAIGLYHLVSMEKWFQNILPVLRTTSGFFATVSLQLIFAFAYCVLASSKSVVFAIPALIHTLYVNPHFDSTTTTNALNKTLHQNNWSLLERHWSYTGYVSVVESLDMKYRALRCDHSLLGGEWLLTPERQENEGWKVNEPIFAVFQTLEAVRLMQLDPHIPDSQAEALVVGLGIGTAPKAFLDHGIDTTIIELDHAVYYYAMEYFGLPKNHTAIIGDAATWVPEAATNETRQQFDYIIHDVFTGGAEPLTLFTESFLGHLRALLKPNGAVALNYAGDVRAPLTSLVLNTIDKVFDGQCKIYRDPTPPDSEAATGADKDGQASIAGSDDNDDNFTNMVIFCRNTPGPITFRRPAEADFLGSKSREYYLFPHPKRELQFPLHNSSDRLTALQDQHVLQSGDEAKWSAQQAESALRHWHIMREVLPSAVWELW